MWVLEEEFKRELPSAEVVEMVFLSPAFLPLLPKRKLIRSEGRAVAKWDGPSATQHSYQENKRLERGGERESADRAIRSGAQKGRWKLQTSSVPILINVLYETGQV